MLEDTGDDICMFHIFLTINDEPEFHVPVIVGFDTLERHIHANAPAEYNYIKKIRDNMHGYGSKHSKVVAILEEECYDFLPHLESFITVDIAKKNCDSNLNVLPTHEAFTKKVEVLSNLIERNILKENNIRYTSFLDALDKTIHELTFKHYPEVFEKGDKVIKDYKNQLVTTTLGFAVAIDKLVNQ